MVFREYSPRKMFCIRTVVDLFLDRHRQSKIIFYAGFSPALEVQKSVIVFTLLSKFSLITIELVPDVLINGVLYDSCDSL